MAIVHKDGSLSHVGLCVSYHERYNSSMDIMSYYVNVYNPIALETESVYVYNDYDSAIHDTFTIDATDEVKSILQAKQNKLAQIRRDREELEQLMTPDRGKRLEVIKGRKVPIGTVGDCFWTGNNGYGASVGIKDASGKVHFTAIGNVQVI